MGFWAYMLHCADRSFYVGHTDDLDNLIARQEAPSDGGLSRKVARGERLAHDADSQGLGVVRQLEVHRELVGHLRAEGRGQLRGVGVGVAAGNELGPQEERMPNGVVELSVLDDVAAVSEQERRDGVNDARSLRAAQGQDEGSRHGRLLSIR